MFCGCFDTRFKLLFADVEFAVEIKEAVASD